jgi:tetratricopeptide (TPR) repeat protein
MAVAGAAATTIGGYLLFMHVSAASIAPLQPIVLATDSINAVVSKVVEVAAIAPDTAPASDAAPTPAPVETVASLQENASQSPAPEQADAANGAGDAARTACASAPAGSGCSVETTGAVTNPPVVIDAKFFHDRGMESYRKGDLAAAVADLDQAIQIDPKFSSAYVDRGLVLYRLRKFDRAFADVASAKRIEKANRAVMDALARKQPLRPLKLDPPKLTRVSQRRISTAAE